MESLDPTPTESLASTFATTLRDWMTEDEFSAVRERNAESSDPMVCHSHDFVDANEAMAAAFLSVLGVNADSRESDDVETWNAAWALAKRNYLTD